VAPTMQVRGWGRGRCSAAAWSVAVWECSGADLVIKSAADPKIDGEWVGGSTRRSAAEPGPGRVCGAGLGGGLKGDLVAERFELADVVALGALRVDAGVVEAGAQVVEAGVGVGE
jgi:hypothetical protein